MSDSSFTATDVSDVSARMAEKILGDNASSENRTNSFIEPLREGASTAGGPGSCASDACPAVDCDAAKFHYDDGGDDPMSVQQPKPATSAYRFAGGHHTGQSPSMHPATAFFNYDKKGVKMTNPPDPFDDEHVLPITHRPPISWVPEGAPGQIARIQIPQLPRRIPVEPESDIIRLGFIQGDEPGSITLTHAPTPVADVVPTPEVEQCPRCRIALSLPAAYSEDGSCGMCGARFHMCKNGKMNMTILKKDCDACSAAVAEAAPTKERECDRTDTASRIADRLFLTTDDVTDTTATGSDMMNTGIGGMSGAELAKMLCNGDICPVCGIKTITMPAWKASMTPKLSPGKRCLPETARFIYCKDCQIVGVVVAGKDAKGADDKTLYMSCIY